MSIKVCFIDCGMGFWKYPQITLSCCLTQKDAPKQTGQNFLLQTHRIFLDS